MQILFNLCQFYPKALCAYCGHLQLHVPHYTNEQRQMLVKKLTIKVRGSVGL